MKPKSLIAFFVGMFLMLSVSYSDAAEMRTWTRKNGKTFEAEFVKLEKNDKGRNTVTLRKSDGTELTVWIQGLGEDDREYVRQHATSAKNDEDKKPAAKVPEKPAKNPNADKPLPQQEKPRSDQPKTESDNSESEKKTVSKERTTATEKPLSDQPKTMTVEAKGSGKDKNEALKDAFREAVRKVVGAVVDAETLVKNDKIISDQVLTYSDGFVPKFEQVSETTEDGLVHVTIRATVERRSVVAKLKAANVTTKVEGENLFAEVVTSLEAEKNGRELLAKAFEGYPANVIEASLVDKPKRETDQGTVNTFGTKDTVIMVYKVRICVDAKKYDAFQKKLVPILDTMAIEKGTVEGEPGEVLYNVPELEAPLQAGGYSTFSERNYSRCLPVEWRKTVGSSTIAVNTTQDEAHHKLAWKCYRLPAAIQAGLEKVASSEVAVDIRFLDKGGKNVDVQVYKEGQYVPSSGNTVVLCRLGFSGDCYGKTSEAAVSPYWMAARGDDCIYIKDTVVSLRIRIPIDTLPQLSSVSCKCRLLPQPGE